MFNFVIQIANWFQKNYEWIINLVIQGFIAYHVFFLSKKLSNREKLKHKDSIKKKTDQILNNIRVNKTSSKTYLVNINRYFKDYPSNKEKMFDGYSHIRAEIKATRFDGVEFFAGMPVSIYKKPNGSLSFKGTEKDKVFNAYPVGVVPYEWIEYVDATGDEYAYVPLFYCHFNGKTNWKFWVRFLFFCYPYKQISYYRLSDVYREDNDPIEMKYEYINEPISKI